MTPGQLTATALFQEAASLPSCSALNWRALFGSLTARGYAHGVRLPAQRWRYVLMLWAIALESLRRAYPSRARGKRKETREEPLASAGCAQMQERLLEEILPGCLSYSVGPVIDAEQIKNVA